MFMQPMSHAGVPETLRPRHLSLVLPIRDGDRTRAAAGTGMNAATSPERSHPMQIRTRTSMSVDGYVTTPAGWPAQIADPAFVPGQSHGFPEFLAGCEQALMGRTTFEPALAADRWPWPTLDVFVLASQRPPGTPDHVVTDSDPARLLAQLRERNRGGDVHLVGGPRTIETFRAMGALDELGLIVLPLLLGDGMRLTPAVSVDAGLTLTSSRPLEGGSVEIVYACGR